MDLPLFGARSDFELEPPRPLRSGLSLALVAGVPLMGGMTGLIRPLSGLMLAGIFVAAGALRASFAYYERARLRRTADRVLRLETSQYVRSSLAGWRARELISAHHRTALARAAQRTRRDLSPARLPGASPLNRVAARPHADLLRRLAERLSALDRPVTPRGVLQVEELLCSPDSPLYAREHSSELRASLLACLDELDGVRANVRARSARSNGFLLTEHADRR